MSDYKDESRKLWSRDSGPTSMDLQTGCLQRIADATELMAKNHARLIRERDMYEGWYKASQSARAKLERRISALRGTITRMKRLALKDQPNEN